MKKFKPKPQEISIFAQVYDGQTLMDKRSGHCEIVIGHVPDIAHQYGVTIRKRDDGFIFIGTKSKMQMLAERLHFAGINYWEV